MGASYSCEGGPVRANSGRQAATQFLYVVLCETLPNAMRQADKAEQNESLHAPQAGRAAPQKNKMSPSAGRLI